MDKKYDVTALGELLIDFTDSGMSGQNHPIFEANPGGAPCNVLAMLKKLNKSCAFIGKVGNDLFGSMLKKIIQDIGIDVSGLVTDGYYNTTLAFVKNDENGERDFSFFRHPGADMMLSEKEVTFGNIAESKIFHFGTLSMTHAEVRKATKAAVEYAKKNHVYVSFDPNLREALWDSLEEAKEQMGYGLSVADIVKISDNEVEFLTGERSVLTGAECLREKYPQIKLLCVTAGIDGSYAYYEDKSVFCPSFLLGRTIETTGAGDTFTGCMLNYILEHGLPALQEEDLTSMLRFANAAAYLVTTKKGALTSMPVITEITGLING